MLNREKQLEAILSLSVTLLVVYFLLWKNEWLLFGLLGLLIFTLLFKNFSNNLADNWLRITHALGRLYTTIILGLLYFLILTPIAFVFRFFNRNKQPDQTNLDNREHTYSSSDFDQIF